MPVQFPPLSTDEQTDLLYNIQVGSIYTVSYLATFHTNLMTLDPTGTFAYKTASYIAPSLSMIVGCRSLGFSDVDAILSAIGWQLSYNSVPNFSDAASLTQPTDSGTIIDQALTNVPYLRTYDDESPKNLFNRFEPGNYILQTGQTIYLHFIAMPQSPQSPLVIAGFYQLFIKQTGVQA